MTIFRWFAVALTTGIGLGPALADDAALLAKLDEIEKRLAHIEMMDQARGPKSPFTVTLPSADVKNVLQLCQSLGYRQSMSGLAPVTSPGAPSATVIVCYGP